MSRYQPLALQAQLAYEAATNSACPDWRAVAELFRAAVGATMILIAFRHGLRASEAVELLGPGRFQPGVVHVRGTEESTFSVHPLGDAEMLALRRLQRDEDAGPFAFVSEPGAPFTAAGFARLMERAARSASIGLKAHPHMLRHACGFALANAGHDSHSVQTYLGHHNIQHTVRYTELASDRFRRFWSD